VSCVSGKSGHEKWYAETRSTRPSVKLAKYKYSIAIPFRGLGHATICYGLTLMEDYSRIGLPSSLYIHKKCNNSKQYLLETAPDVPKHILLSLSVAYRR
jgi:hypothetical protein